MCFLHECTCMILLETQRKIRQRMEMAKVSIIPGILGVMKGHFQLWPPETG